MQCRISGVRRQAREGKGRYCCDGGGKRRDLTQIVWRLDGCDRGELAGLSLVRLDCNNDLLQVRLLDNHLQECQSCVTGRNTIGQIPTLGIRRLPQRALTCNTICF